MALRARGLEKRFGALAVLRGIDLDVARGSIHAVIGPNGAGKSTLLRILAGLAHPSRGEVEIAVGNESLEPRKARHAIGYVGHATMLYPELSARENLIFAARLYRVTDLAERTRTLLEEEGLSDFADRRAGTFSRGMAQRLAIARSRIHSPKILLLDEPFTGLDRRAADALAERLVELRDRGNSLVLITHDLRRAGEIADCSDTLIRGQIVDHCEGDELTPDRVEAGYLNASAQRSTATLPPGGAPG
jgi:heme ABC exporter ATP-binding subunit CcmA